VADADGGDFAAVGPDAKTFFQAIEGCGFDVCAGGASHLLFFTHRSDPSGDGVCLSSELLPD
jgi:hypothetical protein